MKGMTTTLVLDESDNQSPETLETILRNCCTQNGIPTSQRDVLVNNGLELFKYDIANDFVFPLGGYQTITEYVMAHRNEHDAVKAEESSLTKEQLYNRLVKAATAGKMVEYRRLRKQYTAF